MQFIWTIIIGFLAGAVAKWIMPGKDPGGFILTTLLGIGGAIVARYLGLALGFYSNEDSAGFIASVIGAILLLCIYRLFSKRKTEGRLN